MQLKPFCCIHCEAETKNVAVIRLRYRQTVVENWYGRNYQKDDRIVDMGDAPVFVCDNCIRDMRTLARFYGRRALLGALLMLCCVPGALFGFGVSAALIPLFGALWMVAVSVQSAYSNRTAHQQRNNQIHVGLTKSIALATSGWDAYTTSFDLFAPIAAIAACIVFDLFLRGVPVQVLAVALAVVGFITVISSVFSIIESRGGIDEDDILKAGAYYLKYDGNIRLID